MLNDKYIDFAALIENNPDIKQAVSNVNHELITRRGNKPSICNVFLSEYNTLRESDEFTFNIDKEAKKRLPDIINNKVQYVEAISSPDSSYNEKYRKRRNIGIVFSGGPAPGGHNVIAGFYHAAKKANAESSIFGFLLGPDGIVENEYVELTDGIVDEYINLGGFGMIKTGRAKIDSKEKMRSFKRDL